MKLSCPRAKALICARRPLMSVSVEDAPRPRSDTAEAPTGVSEDSGPAVAVEKVPPPPEVTGRSCSTSIMVAAPVSRISSRVTVWVWTGPSVGRPWMRLPVTTMALSSSACAAGSLMEISALACASTGVAMPASSRAAVPLAPRRIWLCMV